MSMNIAASLDLDDSDSNRDMPDEINMANGNAVHVLGLLGFTREQIEEAASRGLRVSPLDMSARLLLVDAMPDHVVERDGFRAGNWVEFGTTEDYIRSRMLDIKDVVEYADKNGRWVDIY